MRERKNNLDLLRIFSMLFIVSLHYLGVGGAFYNIYDGNVTLITCNFCIASWLEALSIVGVNCFVLISGYFLINGTFKWKKVLNLYLITIFYSVVLFVVHSLICGFSISNMLSSVLPVLMSTYWFITVYIILYIMSPYINILCDNLSQKQHRTLIIILFSVFSLWKCVLPIAETIDDRKGYSLTWFIVLYICGAYIKKYGAELFKKNWLNFIAYVCISVFMVVVKIAAIFASTKLPVLARGQNLFYHYDSVTVLGASIFLFVFFLNLKCESVFIGKVIKIIVPSVFSVYLIHENFLWREFLWKGLLKADEMTTSPRFVVHYVICVILTFIVCILIDQIRKGLFYLIPKMTERVVRKGK